MVSYLGTTTTAGAKATHLDIRNNIFASNTNYAIYVPTVPDSMIAIGLQRVQHQWLKPGLLGGCEEHVVSMADLEPHVERQFSGPARDVHRCGRFALDYGCEQLRHADFVGDDGHRRRRSQHDDSGHWCG